MVLAYADFSFTENTCTVKVKARSENFCLSEQLCSEDPRFLRTRAFRHPVIHTKEGIDMYSFFAIFKIFSWGGGEGGGGGNYSYGPGQREGLQL